MKHLQYDDNLPNARQVMHTTQIFLDGVWTQLRCARQQLGWSIETAAEKAGVDAKTYQRWELKKQRPHFRNLIMLLHLFGIEALTEKKLLAFLNYLANLDARTQQGLLVWLSEMNQDDFAWMQDLFSYVDRMQLWELARRYGQECQEEEQEDD